MNYETAAFLAQHLKPEQLFANAAAFITAVLNGDFNPDSLSFDAQASVTPVAATAPSVETSSTAGAASVAEPERKVIHALGNDPVATDPDGKGPKTAIENGFEGNDTDVSKDNDSRIIDSVRDTARNEGLTPEQADELTQRLAADKAHFIEASKTDGYNSGGVTDTKVQKGEYGMGSGSGPEKVTLDLTSPENAVTKTYTLSDGTRVEVTVADKCSNPLIRVFPPEPVPAVAPVEKEVCEPGGTLVSREPLEGGKNVPIDESVTGNERNLRIRNGEEIPVVTIKDMPPEGLHQDYNGDGNGSQPCKTSPVGKEWDTHPETGKQEILPGITQDRIDDDVKYFEEQYGRPPKFIVYDVTDCEGRNVVACWDVEKKTWGFFYPDTPEGIPVDSNGDPVYRKSIRGDYRAIPGKVPATIDTHDELMAFLGRKPGPIT